jgi:hypothetical protein
MRQFSAAYAGGFSSCLRKFAPLTSCRHCPMRIFTERPASGVIEREYAGIFCEALRVNSS